MHQRAVGEECVSGRSYQEAPCGGGARAALRSYHGWAGYAISWRKATRVMPVVSREGRGGRCKFDWLLVSTGPLYDMVSQQLRLGVTTGIT